VAVLGGALETSQGPGSKGAVFHGTRLSRLSNRGGPATWSRLVAAGAGATDRLIDHALGDDGEFDVLALADRAQPRERLLRGRAGTAAEQSDGLVDDRPARQGGLQLDRQAQGLGKHLGVVDRDRGRGGEQLAEFGGVLVEDVLAVGVDVDRPYHLVR